MIFVETVYLYIVSDRTRSAAQRVRMPVVVSGWSEGFDPFKCNVDGGGS